MANTSPQRQSEAELFRPREKSEFVRWLKDCSYSMRRGVRYALHLPTPLNTEDRRVLEQVIFKYLRGLPNTHKVLFVGCHYFTRHYEWTFFRGCEYWTMDVAPEMRRFAGRRHLVAPLQDLGKHFPEGYFDLIICNGVYGFGLNTLEGCEEAFEQCHSRLREDGCLLVGWNDIPTRTPVPLESVTSLARFEKLVCPELGGWRYLTDTPYRHTYDFYRR
jgi:SAM-dependent methyltransferase